MVAQSTVRTYGINQVFQIHLIKAKELLNPFFVVVRERLILYNTCATCSELPSYIGTNVKESITGPDKINIIMVFLIILGIIYFSISEP